MSTLFILYLVQAFPVLTVVLCPEGGACTESILTEKACRQTVLNSTLIIPFELKNPYSLLTIDRLLQGHHTLTMSVSLGKILRSCSFHRLWIRLDRLSIPIVAIFHIPWRLMEPLSKCSQLEACLAIARGPSSVSTSLEGLWR